MTVRLFFFLCFFSALLANKETEYDFYGQHLIVSYYGCDNKALLNLPLLEENMLLATENTGATVLSSAKKEFPGGGFSMIILVSESHSSIHTYPEHGACFLDIFTCGTTCQVERFDESLRAFLKPQKVSKQLVVRQ